MTTIAMRGVLVNGRRAHTNVNRLSSARKVSKKMRTKESSTNTELFRVAVQKKEMKMLRIEYCSSHEPKWVRRPIPLSNSRF